MADNTNQSGERAKPSYDDINVSILVLIGVISTIVTVLIVAAVQGMAYRMDNAYLRTTNQVFSVDPARQKIDERLMSLEKGEGAKMPLPAAASRVLRKYGNSGNPSRLISETGE